MNWNWYKSLPSAEVQAASSSILDDSKPMTQHIEEQFGQTELRGWCDKFTCPPWFIGNPTDHVVSVQGIP